MNEYERWELISDICLSKPKDRGRLLEHAFPFAEIEIRWDENFLRTDVFAYDKRNAIPFTYGCRHELILHETYKAPIDTCEDIRIVSDLVEGLDKYFNKEALDSIPTNEAAPVRHGQWGFVGEETMPVGMTFEEAIAQMRAGKRITRPEIRNHMHFSMAFDAYDHPFPVLLRHVNVAKPTEKERWRCFHLGSIPIYFVFAEDWEVFEAETLTGQHLDVDMWCEIPLESEVKNND